MQRRLLVLGIAGLLVVLLTIATGPLTDPGPEPGDSRSTSAPDVPGDGDSAKEAVSGTGEITGTVRRGQLPVAARMELFALDEEETLLTSAVGRGPALRSTRAGNTGSFSIGQVPCGRFRLRATASDGSTGSAVVRLRLAGERIRTVVEIPTGTHTLRGRAVYADGGPFQGRVSAVESTGSGRLHRTPGVSTAKDGAFRLSGLEPGLVRISCLVPDRYRLVGQWFRIPHKPDVLLVVDRGATVLSGRVVDEADGSPVPGAVLRVIGDTAENRWCVAQVKTDAKGRFSVRVLPVRRAIQVRAKGFSAVERDVPDEVDDLTIRMGRASVLEGRVLAEKDRAPVAGVSVYCEPADNWSDGVWKAVTDSAGRFRLSDAPCGPVTVYALGGGWISPGLGWRSHQRDLEPGAEESLTLLVVPAVKVAGRVVDGTGAGLGGVTVRASTDSGEYYLVPEPPGTVTGADGTFTFENLVPGQPWQVKAAPPGRAPATSRPLVGEPGERIDVTLEIPAVEESSRWLEVRVVERESGESVAGATVRASGQQVRTGDDGVARLGPFCPGKVSVWAKHPEYVISKNHPVLEEGSGLIEMTFPLQRGLAVAGRVFYPDGSPMENGTVRVDSAEHETGAPASNAVGTVTAGGVFRVGGLLAGRYRVKIGGSGRDGGGFWAEVVTEAGVADLSLTTEEYVGSHPQQSLVFRVTDPDGKPVPFGTVEVHFTGEKNTWSNDYPVEDGRATMNFWGLVGTVSVVAHGARTLAGRRLPLGAARVGPVDLAEGELEIRLPAERMISGVVRDEKGRSVAGVRLFATPSFAEELDFERAHSEAVSDERGAFRLGGLGDSEYLIAVEPPTEFLPTPAVPARAGTEDLAVRLARGATVHLRVVDPDGAPLAGARIRVNDPAYDDERTFTGYTRRNGISVLSGLDPAIEYWLDVTPPPGLRSLVPVTRVDFKPADRTITLPAGLMVSGVVVYPDDRPAPGFIVDSAPEGGGHDWAQSARDGTFRFGPYPAGSVRLWVRSTGPKRDSVEVPAGTEDVRLVYAAGARIAVRMLDWSDAYGPVRARLTGFGTRWAVVNKDGSVEFAGLPEGGTYSLWVGPVGPAGDGLHVHLKNLKPTNVQIEAQLVRGGTVTGRLVLPAGARDAGVRVSADGVTLTGLVDAHGAFRVSGIPIGKCVLTAHAKLGRERIEGHAWIKTGDEVTLEIR